MDVDSGVNAETVVSIQPNHSGLSVVIHPLALLNITDHFTRIQVQATSQKEHSKVIDILLGTQAGRKISICNSFEVKVQLSQGNADCEYPEIIVDETYLSSKQEHSKDYNIRYFLLGLSRSFCDFTLQKSLTCV
ncbi:hypothetical protein DSO57_1018508 [Entomophthora muscae]|uniref:Uncharacterized protein n=1 Tax=Entomophthora muscae TaxID=34485 RepID=A0ACC2SGZ0_9FUNG|nr:hypothetical protein DSO57_1018508 [Entomophthora muscae]